MKKTFVINSEFMGQGSNELGAILMGSFLRKLWGEGSHPQKIIFYNSGVKLLSKSSAVLDAVEGLVKAGVELYVCGTCLSYYNLNDEINSAQVSNMQEIVAMIMESSDVIMV